MNIQKGYDYAKNNYQQPKTAVEETQKKNTTSSADNNTDKFDPAATVTHSNTYNKGANRSEHADYRSRAGMSSRQMKNEAVRNMVQSQMSAQASGSGYKPMFGGNTSIMNAFQAAEATSAKHDDYWGVEATAERLFTFAATLAGDDEKLLATMRSAFMKGFRAAEGARGGSLPSISYQTRDRVLEMFDQRASEIAAKKNPPVTAPVTATTNQ
jgi:hypothetical protein